jgi:hypothetical protein
MRNSRQPRLALVRLIVLLMACLVHGCGSGPYTAIRYTVKSSEVPRRGDLRQFAHSLATELRCDVIPLGADQIEVRVPAGRMSMREAVEWVNEWVRPIGSLQFCLAARGLGQGGAHVKGGSDDLGKRPSTRPASQGVSGEWVWVPLSRGAPVGGDVPVTDVGGRRCVLLLKALPFDIRYPPGAGPLVDPMIVREGAKRLLRVRIDQAAGCRKLSEYSSVKAGDALAIVSGGEVRGVADVEGLEGDCIFLTGLANVKEYEYVALALGRAASIWPFMIVTPPISVNRAD